MPRSLTPTGSAILQRVAVLVASVVALAACGGGEAADPAPSTSVDRTTSTSSTADASTTTIDPTDAEIEAAVRVEFESFAAILGSPDPANPLIDQSYVGAAREVMLDAVSERLLGSFVTVRPADASDYQMVSVEITVRDGAMATVLTCAVDGLYRRDLISGEETRNSVDTVRSEVVLVVHGGLWKVSETRILSIESDGDRCVP